MTDAIDVLVVLHHLGVLDRADAVEALRRLADKTVRLYAHPSIADRARGLLDSVIGDLACAPVAHWPQLWAAAGERAHRAAELGVQ